MDSREIIARLRENEATLRAQGITHAALFGSRARSEERSDSDIDIMIEVAPDIPFGVWEYAGVKDFIAGLFDGPVDVVSRECLKPFLSADATREAIYAF